MIQVSIVVTILIGGAASQVFTDECDVSRCGDKCLRYTNIYCHCGKHLFQVDSEEQYCCISTNETCSYIDSAVGDWIEGFCGEGEVYPMSRHCNNTARRQQCHNSYQDSLVIRERAHYTCPHTCVSVRQEMCRGINYCGQDYQECDEDLRCWKFDDKKTLNSSLAPDHHYCTYGTVNDGIINVFDRSDEDTYSTAVGTSYEIDSSLFESCKAKPNEAGIPPGLMCGPVCRPEEDFCRQFSKPCIFGNVSTIDLPTNGAVPRSLLRSLPVSIIYSNDRKLCGNPLVFSNVSCGITCFPCIAPKRCNGTNKHCIMPWYLSGRGTNFERKTCEDKSDQIFTIGLTCGQQLQRFIELHEANFCLEDSSDADDLICTNKTEWLSRQTPAFSDPHNCQESCSDPDAHCISCTNQLYFNCSISNSICIHPDLECDGHPQCPDGEDEVLTRCHEKYIENQIIEPYASYRCASLFYQNMEIFAVPCNGIIECFDHSDEIGCKDSRTANIVLIISSILVLILIVAGHLGRVSTYKRTEIFDANTTKELLEKLERTPEDDDTLQEIHLHLYHTQHTQSVKVNKEVLTQVYESLEANHNEEAKLYHYLNTKFDPVLVQKMTDAKFPGITSSLINLIDNCVCRPIIAEITDYISRTERAKRFLAVISAIIKIEFKYLDIFKDIGLTIIMFELNGGINAVLDLPTNFGSVIVMTMGMSILLPMFLSSLHLGVHNSNMLMITQHTRVPKLRRYLITPFKIVLFPFHPVFLENLYLKTDEQARKMAQRYDMRAVQLKNQ